MSNIAEKPRDTATPLDHLSEMLDGDMRAVNALILKHMDSPVALIPQLASYLIAAGGKRVRPLLTLACTAIYNGEMERAHRLAAAVEFIHTATLLHDDVVDESTQRRGQDAANLIFGNQASVLVGDFLFSRAFQLMTADGSLDVLRILSNASAVIAEGEVMQLSAANDINTSMDQYLSIIEAKTAALFAAACEVGPVIAKAGEHQANAMRAFGLNMGIAFQIIDDTLDYNASREKLGKTIGDDFREGKLTAPVLYALENANDEERAFWQRTFGDRQQTEDDLKNAIQIFEKYDAIKKSETLAYSYKDKAIQALDAVPNTQLTQTLKHLTEFIVMREF